MATYANRFYEKNITIPLGSQARSPTIEQLVKSLEFGFFKVAEELDGLGSRGRGFGDLDDVPSSFSGQALKYLRVNAAASAIEYVAGGVLPISEVTATAYTAQRSDAGTLKLMNNAAAITVTLDTNANQAFTQGETVFWVQRGTGQVTFSPAAGVTIYSSDNLLKTRGQHAEVAALYLGSDQWLLLGERNAATLNYASLLAPNVFNGVQSVAPVALIDAATINTDASLSNTFTVTLGGNRTLANPTNLVNGAIYNWRIRQDGTGNRTLAFGSKFKWPGASAPAMSTGANAIDLISAQYFSDLDILLCTGLKGLA